MSNAWTIHVSETAKGCGWYGKEPCYNCRTSFEIDRWVMWLLDNIPPAEIKSPDQNVNAAWVDAEKVYTLKDFEEGLDLIMVDAKWLKPLKFHEDDWHIQRIARSKAISAFLQELPDDWPCFLYQT